MKRIYKYLLLFLVSLSFALLCQYLYGYVAKHQIITTNKAPMPIGPYSQAVKKGDIIYLSGQIGINPQTNQLISDDIEEQTNQAMQNISAILSEIGLSLNNITSATIYLTNIDTFEEVNRIYSSYFDDYYPARTTLEVSRLPKGAKIEISVIAHK